MFGSDYFLFFPHPIYFFAIFFSPSYKYSWLKIRGDEVGYSLSFPNVVCAFACLSRKGLGPFLSSSTRTELRYVRCSVIAYSVCEQQHQDVSSNIKMWTATSRCEQQRQDVNSNAKSKSKSNGTTTAGQITKVKANSSSGHLLVIVNLPKVAIQAIWLAEGM